MAMDWTYHTCKDLSQLSYNKVNQFLKNREKMISYFGVLFEASQSKNNLNPVNQMSPNYFSIIPKSQNIESSPEPFSRFPRNHGLYTSSFLQFISHITLIHYLKIRYNFIVYCERDLLSLPLQLAGQGLNLSRNWEIVESWPPHGGGNSDIKTKKRIFGKFNKKSQVN